MRTIAVVVAFLLAACSSGTEPKDPVLRLDIALSSSIVDYTDSVRVSLTLTNASTRPVQVFPADAYGLCMHAFEVFDARSRQVSVTEALCALADLIAPQPIVLAPGQEIAITDWWRPTQSTIGGQAIQPGLYQVRGRVFGDARIAHSGMQPVLVR